MRALLCSPLSPPPRPLYFSPKSSLSSASCSFNLEVPAPLARIGASALEEAVLYSAEHILGWFLKGGPRALLLPVGRNVGTEREPFY